MSLNNYTINKKQVKKIKQDLSYLLIFITRLTSVFRDTPYPQ